MEVAGQSSGIGLCLKPTAVKASISQSDFWVSRTAFAVMVTAWRTAAEAAA